MKLTYLTSAGMLFLFLFACTKESNFNDELVVAQARGTAPSERLSVVRLQVRIEDYRGISNDGNEYYTNGQQNVSATIRDTDGQFFFISNTTFKTPQRSLSFTNSALNNKTDYRMVTNFPVALQTMGVGETKLGGMRVWAYVNKSVEDFVMRYRYDIATNQPNLNTSEVQVTRVNEYTWELVPVPHPGTGTADAELKIRPSTSFDPEYDVPFKITLTKI
jgi:hypothetical protein